MILEFKYVLRDIPLYSILSDIKSKQFKKKAYFNLSEENIA